MSSNDKTYICKFQSKTGVQWREFDSADDFNKWYHAHGDSDMKDMHVYEARRIAVEQRVILTIPVPQDADDVEDVFPQKEPEKRSLSFEEMQRAILGVFANATQVLVTNAVKRTLINQLGKEFEYQKFRDAFDWLDQQDLISATDEPNPDDDEADDDTYMITPDGLLEYLNRIGNKRFTTLAKIKEVQDAILAILRDIRMNMKTLQHRLQRSLPDLTGEEMTWLLHDLIRRGPVKISGSMYEAQTRHRKKFVSKGRIGQ